MVQSSSKQKQTASGFLKSIVHPRHKKSAQTTEPKQINNDQTPRLPPLDFKPAKTPLSSGNNEFTTSYDNENVTPIRPKVGHKKSSSSMSVKNLFSDNKNRGSKIYSKEEQKLVLDMSGNALALDLPTLGPSTAKRSSRDFKILKPLQWNGKDQSGQTSRSPSPTKSSTNIWGQEKNKENEAPSRSEGSMLPPARPQANLAKPLPPLSINTTSQPDTVDHIKLYTPKLYSAASQRNFFDYDVSLKPRPQSMALGERKSSWNSITSLSGRTPSISGSRKTSADLQRGRSISGRSVTDHIGKNPSTFVGDTSICSLSSGTSSLPTSILNDSINIEDAFETLLDARGVPQNMRSKLRALDPRVKADFIKQDKEESNISPGSSMDSRHGTTTRSMSPQKRPALTSFGKSSGATMRSESPTKKSFDIGRGSETTSKSKHLSFNQILKKTTSSTSLANLTSGDRSFRKKNKEEKRPTSSHSNKGLQMNNAFSSSTHSLVSSGQPNGEVYAKRPEEFLEYLKTATPDTAEVGWLHKLKLMLRNERLSWVETFLNGGGFTYMVNLLYALLDLEWRDEHHEKLLDWCLIALKALCTSPLALQTLDAVHLDLFTRLVALLFDPERKGPAEFTTRGLITGLLFTYISTATPSARAERANELLRILSDPVPRESARPIEFIDRMRTRRPYKRWCKEVSDVTKEVFWIFLHHQNVIPYLDIQNDTAYGVAHFPTARLPVAAAPYVGGVEWEATNYLASHLDLLNAITVSLPTRDARNDLRRDLKNSGWEKVMGGSLRTASTKFYGAVHEGLKTWVSAAKADAWESVSSVRCGTFNDDEAPKSPRKKVVNNKSQKDDKVALPKLDFEMKGRVGGPEEEKQKAIKVDNNGEADLEWQF